jgi:hypothetical protein
MTSLEWKKSENISSHQFTCGYCGNPIASDVGWEAHNRQGHIAAHILICHFCTKPTFIDNDNKQYPGAIFGDTVSGIGDESVLLLYEEARRTMSVSSYTAAVLACRKLLMHIAVQKGAAVGETFVSYVQFLADHHYIPPDAVSWVDHIREKGNEANHEISIMKKEDAETLLSFIAMLLKVIYEFPARIKPPAETPPAPAA